MRRVLLSLFILIAVSISAADLPQGFNESILATGLNSPVSLAVLPDGRIFIAEQGGSVRVWKNGSLLSAPFIRVSVDSTGDRGLAAIVLDPNFVNNSFVYLLYTMPTSPARNVVMRVTAGGDVAIPGSEFKLIDLPNFGNNLHQCDGSLAFGIDGKLFIGVPDNTVGANASDPSSLFGKILRINPDGSIPADNPFYGSLSGNARAIWARGLRDAFTMDVERGTGRLFANEVGTRAYEEINDIVAGGDYGWPHYEGASSDPAYLSPFHAYANGTGPAMGCCITGGTFYRPLSPSFPPAYAGCYFYIDYCGGWIRYLDLQNGGGDKPFASSLGTYNVTLKTGDDGSLYYIARTSTPQNGQLRRIQYVTNTPPSITLQPENRTLNAGDTTRFTVSVSGTPPFNFQWQRNGAPISGAVSASYTLTNAQSSDDGALFRCVISNPWGSVTSNEAKLTVHGNRAPSLSLASPRSGYRYSAGETLAFSASATDPEDGVLPASAFSWRIEKCQPGSEADYVDPISGQAGGSVWLTDTGESASTVFYRFTCTVRDSLGRETTIVRELTPKLADVTLRTEPAGLVLEIDGQSINDNSSFTGVVGFRRNLNAPSPQRLNGAVYDFSGWSNNQPAAHTIVTPSTAQTFTATFTLRPPPAAGAIATDVSSVAAAGVPVLFSATASSPSALSWNWNFGDGTESSQAESVSHVYTQAGVYTVVLTLVDDQGQSSQQTLSVTVLGDDLDGDGITNNDDLDDDGDGIGDADEVADGTDPFDAASFKAGALKITSFSAQILDAPALKDSVAFKVSFAPPVGGDPKSVALGLSQFSATYALDQKLRMSSKTAAVKIDRKKGKDWVLSVKLSRSNLALLGADDISRAVPSTSLPLDMRMNGRRWMTPAQLSCTHKNGVLKMKLSKPRR
ncbi:MAG TPA: PQQ-dependent sugar dehydrogenase [Planctomycetota bacterium]|nr:PQQ-dependent sugar dehydrogenase [Planctomycetota bacterium]